jgi:hypothetical protein
MQSIENDFDKSGVVISVKNLKFEIISSGKFKGTVKRTEIS